VGRDTGLFVGNNSAITLANLPGIGGSENGDKSHFMFSHALCSQHNEIPDIGWLNPLGYLCTLPVTRLDKANILKS
jgi:hypothetical protein